MPDVILINPPIYETVPFGKIDNDEHWSPPLGIAYIAAVLKKNNIDVKSYDFYYTPKEQIIEILNNLEAQIIGISCFSEQRTSVFELVHDIKSLNKDVLVLLGGPHSNFMYEQIMSNYPIDGIILGEGELTFLEVAKQYLKGRDYDALYNIKGLVLRSPNGIMLTKDRELITELDDLPFPDYSDFIYTKYASTNWFRGSNKNGKALKDMKWTSVIGSRGCAYNCSFCTTPMFWKRKWRKRSPINIVDEIEMLNKVYGYEFFNFADDIFTLNEQWTIGICDELIRRNLDICFSCCTRVDAISIPLLKKMKDANCHFISFGVESFSEKILDSVNKNITKERILEACRLCNEAEINFEFLLIVGSPGETDESIEETIYLINETKPFGVQPSIMTVFPGSALYDTAVQNNFINDEYWLTDLPCPYYTKEHNLETLKKWYFKIRNLDKIEKSERPV